MTLATVVMSISRERFDWVEQAVRSIREQTFRDYDALLICDGEVSVGVGEYLGRIASEDSRFRVLRIPNARGLTAALIEGIRTVRTELLIRHDADDWSDRCRFERQIALLSRDSRLGVVGTNFFGVDEEGRTVYRSRWPTDEAAIRVHLRSGSPFCHGSVVMRRAAYEIVGGYRPEFTFAQDYDLFWRISERFSVCNLEEPLYYFRRRAGSISEAHTITQLQFCEAARILAAARDAGQTEEVTAAIASGARVLESSLVKGRAVLRSGDYLMVAGRSLGALKKYLGAWALAPYDPYVYGKLARLMLWLATPRSWRGFLLQQ